MKKSVKKLATRDLKTLVDDFEKSVGYFEEFHNSLNGEEKIMLKAYLKSLREGIFNN